MNNNNLAMKSLDCLEFDIKNPRLPSSIDRQPNTIIKWMLSNEHVEDLMISIGEKGYFIGEPILIIPDVDHEGKYIVIEGNRRYTSVLLLSHPDLATIKNIKIKEIVENAKFIPTEIPTLSFGSREEIIDYLGYRHITGVEPWDALSKARYLKQLADRIQISNFTEKCKSLAKQIGSKSNYVRQLLLGLDLFEKISNADFYNIPNLDDRSFEFGTFYTGIVSPNISHYLNIDLEAEYPLENIKEDHLRDFTIWLFKENDQGQTRLGESRNLRLLNKILDPKYETALNAFKNDGVSLSVAVELTDQPDMIVKVNLQKVKDDLNLAWKYLPMVKDCSAIDIEELKDDASYLRRIKEYVENWNQNKAKDDFSL